MRSYEIEGPRLSVGATHKLKPSPSAWPESQNIYIPLRSTSYVLDSIPNPCVDQFLTVPELQEKQIYAERTAVGRFTLRRNPALHGTTISINLSRDGSQ